MDKRKLTTSLRVRGIKRVREIERSSTYYKSSDGSNEDITIRTTDAIII